jgi:hypothetical protein
MKKKIILITAIILTCIGFASCINITPLQKRGNGSIITSERTVSAFERINSSGTAIVRFHAGDEFRVVLTVDENLEEYIEITTRGNTLNIGTRSGSFSFTRFIVDVYAPTLSGVSVSGSGRFENFEKITVPAFEATVSGSGRITGIIESERFSTTISGSGRVTVLGSSQNLDVRISGSGRFIGNEFVTNNATARISGSGGADIYVTDNLNVNISGSGSVTYRGNPRIDSRISSGRVRRMEKCEL